LVPLTLLVLVKVLLQQRFLLKLKFYDCPFSWHHRYGTNPAILIMVAIGRSELLS
jgi:hypothetical protein